MQKVTIGIIGGGFVGAAISRVFMHYTDVRVYDIDPTRRTHDLAQVCEQDVIFVCLPTPMRPDGTVDDTIVDDALYQIEANLSSWKPVIVKSTIPPESLIDLSERYGDLIYLVFSPEFLTERTAELDLQQSTRFIFGASRMAHEAEKKCHPREFVELLFEQRFPKVPQYWTSYATASLVKYFTNVFFATKIALMNEFHAVAENWHQSGKYVIDLMLLDARIGRSHDRVPGHDGQLGFGGHCFIKDLHGYLHVARDVGVDPLLGRAAWQTNVIYRGAEELAQELTRMVGRAASEPMTPEGVKALADAGNQEK